MIVASDVVEKILHIHDLNFYGSLKDIHCLFLSRNISIYFMIARLIGSIRARRVEFSRFEASPCGAICLSRLGPGLKYILGLS